MAITQRLTVSERLLSVVTDIRAGEGRCTGLLFLQGFALMCAYYLVRPVREALILTEGGAELRNYAVGIQALLLILIVPAYGALVRRIDPSVIFQRVCAFFAANLLVLAALNRAAVPLGVVFFIWASLFGVMLVTQFWAFATDLFSVKSGHRLFGVIAIGLSSGGWAGSRLAAAGFEALGPCGLMLCSAAVLLAAGLLSGRSRASVPAASRSSVEPAGEPDGGAAGKRVGGFTLIARSPYLLGIAALVVLLNWITSAGEFVLSDWLLETARHAAPGDEAAFITRFMGNYSASITLVGFIVQLLLVSRIILAAGIVRALVATPVAFVAGYLVIGIVPVFAVVQLVMIVQRSLDYSLLNTTRSALLLPASREVKYQAKTAIDTFFYRAGDLMASLSILIGVQLLQGSRWQLVWMILVLSVSMSLVAWLVGREYSRLYGVPRRAAGAATTGSAHLPHGSQAAA